MSHILVVEDNPINQEILVELLRDAGHSPLAADDGETAWRRLHEQPDHTCAVLLDRMLPDMDGLELLNRIKSSPGLAHIPVILQTARSDPADILEGLRGGAYYYLTKPFYPEALLAIVATATRDYREYKEMQIRALQASQSMRCLTEGEFIFRTPDEARDIAGLLANTGPEPRKLVLGLCELMVNAIEHGNFGITYAEKTELIQAQRLRVEIERRLANPAYAERRARLRFTRDRNLLRFDLQDQGGGFDWREYLELSPARVFDNHGRGIALARLLSFDSLDYNDLGNAALATVRLSG